MSSRYSGNWGRCGRPTVQFTNAKTTASVFRKSMTIDFEQRLTTYNVADPLSRFTLVAVRWVPNRRLAEVFLLERLAETATQSRGEWFLMPLEDATGIFVAD